MKDRFQQQGVRPHKTSHHPSSERLDVAGNKRGVGMRLSADPSQASKTGQRHRQASWRGGSQNSQGQWMWGVHACVAALAHKRRHVHRWMVTDMGMIDSLLAQACTQAQTWSYGRDKSSILALHQRAQVVPRGQWAHKLGHVGADEPCVHQGVAVCVEPLNGVSVSQLDARQGMVLVLDEITDPQNVGALWRSAAAFEAQAVMMTKNHCPPLHGTVSKAACGALEYVPCASVTNLVTALDTLRQQGFFVVGLAEGHAQTVHHMDLWPVALVVGAEGKGLRRLTREHCDVLGTIDTNPHFSTLNAAASGAIALHHFATRCQHIEAISSRH